MNNALIIIIGFLGALLIGAFVAITLLVPGDKTIAYVGLGVVAGLFIPQLMTFKSSTDNAAKLEAVDQKVNGHLSGLTKDIKTLTEKVTSLESDKAAARVELAHAVDSEARITATVVAALTPPGDTAKVGDQH